MSHGGSCLLAAHRGTPLKAAERNQTMKDFTRGLTSKFDLSRYRRVDDGEKLAREVEAGADATMKVGKWTRYVAGQEARQGGEFEAAIRDNGERWVPFAREVFSRGFSLEGDEPIDTEGEELHVSKQWIAEAHRAIDANDELREVLDGAKGDPWKSGMVTRRVVEEVARVVQPPEESSEDIEKQIEALKEMVGDAGNSTSNMTLRKLHARKRKAQKAEKAMVSELQQAAGSLAGQLQRAAVSARAEISDIDEALDAFGMGASNEGGSPVRIGGDRAALVKAFRNSEEFRRLAKLAGRMRSRALQKQRDRAPDGRVELSALKRGSDLSRLTPTELGSLADPDREAALVRKINEGTAEVYDLLGKEQRGDGPIIMLLDESGSMEGAPNEYVKAAAIAMLSVAALQKRAIAFIPFSNNVGLHQVIIEDAEDADPRELVKLAECFIDGGTAFAPPLERAMEILDESPAFKRADVVIVTDGEAYDRAEYAEAIEKLKRTGAHLYALLVGDDASDELAAQCDESMRVEFNDDDAFDGMFAL